MPIAKDKPILEEKCPLCGHTPVYKESPEDDSPHIYYCHACNRGFDYLGKTAGITRDSLDTFTRAYIEAAFFSSTDNEDTPLDGKYDIEDIAPSTLETMVKDCQQFQQQNSEALTEKGTTQGGHDFWLTRNHHGSGFFDGDWPENGRQLTLASKKYGEVDLYVGDDGYIYQGGTETGETVPPRDEFAFTDEDRKFLDDLRIKSSIRQKTAVYVEEQWEDILQKKGFTLDQTIEAPGEDTIYTNDSIPDVQVLLHESGEPYYLVELNGNVVEQGTDPETLWKTLNKLPELYRKSIKHPRELNDKDREEMGILAMKKSKLFDKSQPKLALDFDPQAGRQYDYESSGNDVVLISPANTTKLLHRDEANNFWVTLDHIENETMDAQEEYLKRIQDLVRSYFDKEAKAASKKYAIQVDATSLKRASVTFVSRVEYKDDRVEKIKFTTTREKAATFSQTAAAKVIAQLPEFRLTGSVKG